MKPTFCAGSCGRALNSTGRRPTFSACSDTRAARLAERVEENVAMARTSVPPAVASEAIVLVSAIAAQATAPRHAALLTPRHAALLTPRHAALLAGAAR